MSGLARVLLLRSIAIWCIPAFAVVEVLTISSRHQVWASEWRWAFDYLGATTVVLGPLCAGVGAAAAILWSTAGRAAVVQATGRSSHHVAGSCLGITASVWATHAAALALVAVLVLRRDVGGHPDPFAAIPALMIVPAYIAVGLLAGTVRPVLWTCPVVVAVSFVGTILLLRTPLSVLVRSGGATGSLVALEYKPWLLVTQLLFWGCVTAGAVVLAGRVQERPVLNRLLAGLLLACLVSACSAVWLGPSRFRIAADPPLICQGVRPQVCTAPDYSRRLDPLVRAAAQVDRLFAGARVPAPSRYEQGALARRDTLPEGVVNLGAIDGSIGGYSFANGIVNRYLGCPPLTREGQQVRQSAAPLLWLLLHVQDAPEAADIGDEVSPAFRAAGVIRWQAWLREAIPRLQECRPAPVAK